MSEEHEPEPRQIGATLARELPSPQTQDLQKILNRSVTLEMRIEEFLLVAGWCGYHRSQTYLLASDELKQAIDGYSRAEEKRQNLSNADVRFWNSLEAYNHAGGQIMTLGDLKEISRGARSTHQESRVQRHCPLQLGASRARHRAIQGETISRHTVPTSPPRKGWADTSLRTADCIPRVFTSWINHAECEILF